MFALRAAECVKLSQERLLERPASDDPHRIVFSQYRSEVHGPVLQAMLQPKVRHGSRQATAHSAPSATHT